MVEVYMTEAEPTIKVWLAAEVRPKDADALIKAVASVAIEDSLKLGQGEFNFVEEMEKEKLKEAVSIEAGRRFYNLYYPSEKPSPIMTTVINEVGKLVADDERELDRKGKLVAIKRPAWDREASKIIHGESSVKYGPGSEKRSVLEAFNAYLPKVETKKKDKKKSTKKP
jgi:hypothetical protein